MKITTTNIEQIDLPMHMFIENLHKVKKKRTRENEKERKTEKWRRRESDEQFSSLA